MINKTKEAVIATTTLAKFNEPWERIRAECSLETIESARKHGFKIVAVDGGSEPSYIGKMQQLGALVIEQTEPGMGNARRQAIREARNQSNIPNLAIVWLEPEKNTMIPHLKRAVDKVHSGFDLAMFRRRSLASYPEEQAMTYRYIALAVKYATGLDTDFGFGPVVFSRKGSEYFLNFRSKNGDSWDSIHCPKLRIIHDGLPWTTVDINYHHPAVQSKAETGTQWIHKRIKQADSLIGSLEQEAKELGMYQSV